MGWRWGDAGDPRQGAARASPDGARSSPTAAWVARKASRAPDPLGHFKGSTAASAYGPTDLPVGSEEAGATATEATPVVAQHLVPGTVTARVGSIIVARSCRVQMEMRQRRYYFPLEDCVHRHFETSTKRWV